MAKTGVWNAGVFGPINVLDNAPALRIERFLASDLDLLQHCNSAREITLYSSKDKIPVDFAKIQHIRDLRIIDIERCEVTNMDILWKIPNLCILRLDKKYLNKSQTALYDEVRSGHVTPNYKAWTTESKKELKLECKNDSEASRVEYLKTLDEHIHSLRDAMLDGNMEYAFAEANLEYFSYAVKGFYHKNPSSPALYDKLITCTDDKKFEIIVREGLDAHYMTAHKLFLEAIASQRDRLLEPLMNSFSYYLNSMHHGDKYYIGKFDKGIHSIAKLLTKIANPTLEPVFELFLKEQDNFSDLHLSFYKKILPKFGKLKSKRLLPLVLSLPKLEKKAVYGDPAFVKACFKAIGLMGSQEDVMGFQKCFDVSKETRNDILKVHRETIEKLNRKTP